MTVTDNIDCFVTGHGKPYHMPVVCHGSARIAAVQLQIVVCSTMGSQEYFLCTSRTPKSTSVACESV